MPSKLILDCSTGVATEVELTAEEVSELEANALAHQELQAIKATEAEAEAEAKASALAKLEALGLTEEEAAALIS